MTTQTNMSGSAGAARWYLLVLLMLVLGAAGVPAALAQPVALVGGTVHPVTGPVIENGVVLMEGGRIVAVGPADAVAVPAGARRIDARGKVVTPGLIDAATAVGLVEVGSVASTRDDRLRGDPIRAAFRVTDGLNPNSVVIPVTRLGGVTTVAALPSGGVIAGQGAVIDLDGATAGTMLVRDGVALVASFDPGGAADAGGGRGGLALRLHEVFDDAQFYAGHRDAYQRGAVRDVSVSRLDLEALQPVLGGAMPLVVHASRASDIDAALRLARAYGLRLVILGGEEAWMRADTLAAAGVPVILKPLSNLPSQFDQLGTRFDNAALLAAAGVPVVISTMTTHNVRTLRFEAGNAVRAGLPWDAALRAVTQAPAQVLGVAATHGALAAGQVANVVVWSGDPFEFASQAEHVFIRGREVPPDSRQRRLLERYQTLDARPPQYRGQQ